MTIRTSLIASIALIAFVSSATSAMSQQITKFYLSTEPLMIMDTPKGSQGMFADLMTEIGQEAGRNIQINRLPWKRAQETVKKGQHLGIAPLTRSRNREPHYKWIAPLMPMRAIYITRRGNADKARMLSQIQDLRVGVKRGTTGAFVAKLHELPDEKVTITSSHTQLIDMLESGRIDVWLTWDILAYRAMNDTGRTSKFETAYTHEMGDLYVAASKSISAEEETVWRDATAKVINRGSLQRILTQYLGEEFLSH